MSSYHEPVLLMPSVDALVINPDGVYVDVTYGGGGHSREILNRLSDNGRLIALDRDYDSFENKVEDSRLTVLQGNFRYVQKYLRTINISKVDGLLADLGVSSHQFDEASRGFSYSADAALDMRMNKDYPSTAADVIQEYSAEQLQDIFSAYGEVRNAKTLAQAIVRHRKTQPLHTTSAFVQLLDTVRRGERNRYMAQVFQALRIEVNEEMQALRELLTQCGSIISSGGRLVVISYHSLEDREVKKYIRDGHWFKGQPDIYEEYPVPKFKALGKLIIPDEEEIKQNSRARSAKMRIAMKK